MDEQIIAIFCLCDDLLKRQRHREDPQSRMTDAEVMTTAIVAARFFGGNAEHARRMLDAPRYIPGMLSKSRLNRRIHALEASFVALFQHLAESRKHEVCGSAYVIDSFPIPVCDNIRIRRCRLYREEMYRGYTASKKRFFYGLKAHLMITTDGHPIECFFTPGSVGDVAMLPGFTMDLPAGSSVYADKAYTWYDEEDFLLEAADIHLCPARKKNSLRAVEPWVASWRESMRKRIETAISQIQLLFPKSIHAVTPQGFELKAFLFVLAYAVTKAM
jgi:hypothetical protein